MRTTFLVASMLCVLAACGPDKDPVNGATSATSSTSASSASSTTSSSSSSSTASSSSSSSSSSSGTGGAGGAGGAGGFTTAPHDPFPVLNPHSKHVLSSVDLVTITFQGDPRTADARAFGDHVVGSAWYTTVGADYGVGAGKHVAKFVLPEATPAMLDEATLLGWVDAHIQDGTLPKIGPQTLYMLYVPASVKFSDGQGGVLCTDSYGYHSAASGKSGTILYGVIGDCGSLDDYTSTVAHELIEAATDPVDAYYIDGPADDPWSFLPEGTEVGDLCEFLPLINDGTYAVQRIWSQSAAAKGQNPCIPVPPGEVYKNVSASPEKLVALKAGQNTKFKITGWSDAPTAPWPVMAQADKVDFKPTVKFVAPTIQNGQTVEIELGVPMGTPAGSVGLARIYSDATSGVYWPIGVVVK